jgi:hypothetical protein
MFQVHGHNRQGVCDLRRRLERGLPEREEHCHRELGQLGGKGWEPVASSLRRPELNDEVLAITVAEVA